jgi:hypothetical protein
MSIRYYARNGDEITMEQWSGMLGDLEYKRVAYTTIGDAWVSTVWLGMEHAFLLQGDVDHPVHIFETMVFGGPLDQEQWRYGSEAQALDGHAHAVELARVAYQLELPDAEVARPTLAVIDEGEELL